jgi:hypothetical protein
MVMTRIAADLNDLRHRAYQRARGRCEITGVTLPGGPDGPWALHHRRPKQMGGTNKPATHTLPNVLAITHEIHNLATRSVHLDPEWARPRGYLLRQHQIPRLVPVLIGGHQWAILGLDGAYLDVTGT